MNVAELRRVLADLPDATEVVVGSDAIFAAHGDRYVSVLESNVTDLPGVLLLETNEPAAPQCVRIGIDDERPKK